jgi:hypothetical protein
MGSRSASPAGPFCGQSLTLHCALDGSGVSAVRHPPSKFIARSTEFTAFGAVILKYALGWFFHGAHSMHMPQNSFVSAMPSSQYVYPSRKQSTGALCSILTHLGCP